MYADTASGAAALVREQGIETLADEMDRMVAQGDGRWVPDPQVYGVWGFQGGIADAILVVVYTQDCDFEITGAGEGILL